MASILANLNNPFNNLKQKFNVASQRLNKHLKPIAYLGINIAHGNLRLPF